MAAETLPHPNGVVSNGDLDVNPSSNAAKKSRESERRRRRRKQKKNKASTTSDAAAGDENDADDDAKENDESQQVCFVIIFFFLCRDSEKLIDRVSFDWLTGIRSVFTMLRSEMEWELCCRCSFR